jgi:hypothetical protein
MDKKGTAILYSSVYILSCTLIIRHECTQQNSFNLASDNPTPEGSNLKTGSFVDHNMHIHIDPATLMSFIWIFHG